MKKITVANTTSNLTQDDARNILQECIDSETSESKTYEMLMTLIRNFRESMLINDRQCELQKSLEIAKRISSMLRKNSQFTGNIKYYYFGMYQAKLEQIQEELLETQVSAKQHEVANRKHFASIMQILYSQQIVQQSELSKQLLIDRGNLSREMDRLILAGFVEERKAGKFKLYNLSAQGHYFYNQYLLMQSQFQPVQQFNFSESKMNRIYRINEPIRYQENSPKVHFCLSSEKMSHTYCTDFYMSASNIDYESIDYKNEMMEVR